MQDWFLFPRKEVSRMEEERASQVFNEDKFKELVLHVADRSQSDSTFGAVKLNKVLFFSDFLAFANFGQAITGAEYIKLNHGPAPKLMMPIRQAMEAEGDILVIQQEHFGYMQARVVPRRRPDFSEFTAREIALVDSVLESVKYANATELSELTHRLLGWKIAADRAVIPYESIFLAETLSTTWDELRARELALKYDW
jgi:hypothetical protein